MQLKVYTKLLNKNKEHYENKYGFLRMILGSYEGNHIVTSKKIIMKYKNKMSITSSNQYSEDKSFIGISFIAEKDTVSNIFGDTEKYISSKIRWLRKSQLN